MKRESWNYRSLEDHGIDNSYESLKGLIEEKGVNWAAAALVWGSIGYHTPDHALIVIRNFLKGEEKDNCERCYAIFNCDLVEMVYYDLSRFIQFDQDRQDKHLEYFNSVVKADSDTQLSLGLMYPTSGLH